MSNFDTLGSGEKGKVKDYSAQSSLYSGIEQCCTSGFFPSQPRLVHSLSHESDVDLQRGTHHRLSIFTQLQKREERV